MDAASVQVTWEAAERHVKAAYGDQARIVRHAPLYLIAASATQIDPTPPLEIWVFDAQRGSGQAITLIASRSPDGWSVIEKA
jgi:hypothetical protein